MLLVVSNFLRGETGGLLLQRVVGGAVYVGVVLLYGAHLTNFLTCNGITFIKG